MPGLAYEIVGLTAVEVPPVPKFQKYDVAPVEELLNVMFVPVQATKGLPVKLVVGLEPKPAVNVAVVVHPPGVVAVQVTGNQPAVVYV
jgi:hypothetical protein